MSQSILQHSDWSSTLTQFSQATSLGVTLYLADGSRALGPIYLTEMGKFLKESGFLELGRPAGDFEKNLALRTMNECQYQEERFQRALTLACIPLLKDKQVLGAISFGWVFDHFTDSVECNEVAQHTQINSLAFWQVARLQPGTSHEKLATYRSLLETMSSTMIKQLVSLETLNESARLKDELLAVVSHELKTPLTSMLLRLQLLQRSQADRTKINEVLHNLESSTLNLASLVDDLLDSARMLTGKFRINIEPLDLAIILKDAMETVLPAAHSKKIDLESKGLEGTYPFPGDAVRLQQMFWNLIANAVKFTPEAGKVWISISRFGPHYIIQISDNGEGIEEDFLPLLFDRFSQHESTITSRNKGLGLGLSIVKHIAEIHGGEISAMSKGKGQGSSFVVKLPVN